MEKTYLTLPYKYSLIDPFLLLSIIIINDVNGHTRKYSHMGEELSDSVATALVIILIDLDGGANAFNPLFIEVWNNEGIH